jgi:hypothetical protein
MYEVIPLLIAFKRKAKPLRRNQVKMLNTYSTNNTTTTVLSGFEFQINYLRQCNTLAIVLVFKGI